MVNSDEKDKKWHDQQLIILKGWAEISASYRWLHYRTHIRYKIKNYCYMIPIIIMSLLGIKLWRKKGQTRNKLLRLTKMGKHLQRIVL